MEITIEKENKIIIRTFHEIGGKFYEERKEILKLRNGGGIVRFHEMIGEISQYEKYLLK